MEIAVLRLLSSLRRSICTNDYILLFISGIVSCCLGWLCRELCDGVGGSVEGMAADSGRHRWSGV